MVWFVEAKQRAENGQPLGIWHLTAKSDEGGGFVVGCDHDHRSAAEAEACPEAKAKIGAATGFPDHDLYPEPKPDAAA